MRPRHTRPRDWLRPELEIIEFERRAWIAGVIGNPAGRDPDAYLRRRIDGMI
jgi:hypothetical protein